MASSVGFHENEALLTAETKDRHRALASLQEELEAIDWYDQRVDAAGDPELKAILAHNRDEETRARPDGAGMAAPERPRLRGADAHLSVQGRPDPRARGGGRGRRRGRTAAAATARSASAACAEGRRHERSPSRTRPHLRRSLEGDRGGGDAHPEGRRWPRAASSISPAPWAGSIRPRMSAAPMPCASRRPPASRPACAGSSRWSSCGCRSSWRAPSWRRSPAAPGIPTSTPSARRPTRSPSPRTGWSSTATPPAMSRAFQPAPSRPRSPSPTTTSPTTASSPKPSTA